MLQMDKRTLKLMMMHKTLHLRDDIDRLYVSWKKGRRGLTSIQDSVNASIWRIEGYMIKSKERLITDNQKQGKQ